MLCISHCFSPIVRKSLAKTNFNNNVCQSSFSNPCTSIERYERHSVRVQRPWQTEIEIRGHGRTHVGRSQALRKAIVSRSWFMIDGCWQTPAIAFRRQMQMRVTLLLWIPSVPLTPTREKSSAVRRAHARSPACTDIDASFVAIFNVFLWIHVDFSGEEKNLSSNELRPNFDVHFFFFFL